MSLIAIGYHFQAVLFVLVFLWLFYEGYFRGLKRNRALFFEGVVLGLGLYFNLQALVALASFFIFTWMCNRRSFFHPSILLFFLGFLLGYAPGLYDNLTNRFQLFFVYDKPFYERLLSLGIQERFIFTIKRSILFLVRYIPQAFRFEKSGLLAPLLSWGYTLLVAFSFWTLARKTVVQVKLLLFYPGLLSLVYLLSDFGLGVYRYLSPLGVFFCILLGLHFGAPDRKDSRTWKLLRIAPLAICMTGWIPFLTTPRVAQAFQRRGFSYSALSSGLAWTQRVFGISMVKENLARLLNAAHAGPGPDFLPVFEQFAGDIVFYGSKEENLEKDIALIDAAEEEPDHRANVYQRLGYAVACNEKTRPDIKTLLVRIEGFPSGVREALAEGVGECVFTENLSFESDPPAGLRDPFYRGIGAAFATIFEEDFAEGVRQILNRPRALHPILFEGFGKGTYWWDGGRGEITRTLVAKVPAPYQSYFQRGLKLATYQN